jgi:uncharacterized protein (DUF488 family)
MKRIFTIGYTKKSAEHFFDILKKNKIDLIADVRLNNKGQLAGFTKEKDFIFFLSLFGIEYTHLKDFAPTKKLRDSYHSDWNFGKYKASYFNLIENRNAVKKLADLKLPHNNVCLLCSEPEAEKCHRSLAADKISKSFNIPVIHI